MSFLLLLSFLTQYISKRYLYHSYTKSIFNHLILFIAQLTILVLLCNLEIHILFFLLAPWFILIDWIILVRNSISLRNVLKSNVRDLKLTSSTLYIEQYKLSQIYSVFMPVLLTALFFGALTVLFHHYSLILRIIFVVPCLSSSISMFGKRYFSKIPLYPISKFVTLGLLFIHLFLLSFPLYTISLQMFVSSCINRIRGKEHNYRFNYSHFSNLRSPY